jgi:RHS repeat-associated protein
MTAIGGQASFVYDAFGRRASVTKNGQAAIGYLYSGDDVIQEQQSGAVLAAMLTGLGVDERYVRAGELVFTDLIGSTVALSNGATIQTSYAYDPYGVTTSAGAATTNTYQFTGRENDGTTAGLMYYRARYYNPAWGRFVSEDPIGVAGGVNLYGYVRQSPINGIDPNGHQFISLSTVPDEVIAPRIVTPRPFIPEDPFSPESVSQSLSGKFSLWKHCPLSIFAHVALKA